MPNGTETDNKWTDEKFLFGGPTFGSSLTDKDWAGIFRIIREKNVKSVLEFGSGLSTLLFSEMDFGEFVSYETEDEWIGKVSEAALSPLKILKWDGMTPPSDLGHYDLAFVDGPGEGFQRKISTETAAKHSPIVIVHDCDREWERKWQIQFLETNFALREDIGDCARMFAK